MSETMQNPHALVSVMDPKHYIFVVWKLLSGSLTLKASRYPCYKYICVCKCIYEYRNTDAHVVFIYCCICQISQELE